MEQPDVLRGVKTRCLQTRLWREQRNGHILEYNADSLTVVTFLPKLFHLNLNM